ncbi:MAG: DNA-processing protein DprA, partial [Paludibacter sp.]
GLAYGIDIYAHKAALHNNMKTFAVLGHGLDQIYPSSHKAVAKEITQNGNLITELLRSSTFDKTNFVKRNRIVAGMTDATIVIESAAKGGALITADIANSYNRDVFAVPGRSSDKYSEGCNFLIKTNKAALVDSAEDIIYLLGWNTTKSKKPIQKELFVDLTDEEKTIYNYLKGENNLNIDAMCRKLDIPVSKASSILLSMEFKGVVKSLPGKIYTIN